MELSSWIIAIMLHVYYLSNTLMLAHETFINNSMVMWIGTLP